MPLTMRRVEKWSTCSCSIDICGHEPGGSWNQSWTQLHDTVATADTDYPAKALVGHQRRQSAGGNPASGGGSAGSNPAGGTKFDLGIRLLVYNLPVLFVCF